MDGVSVEFTCKCKKMRAWISEDKETKPCPNCNRKYIGVYDSKKLTIIAKEIK